MKKYFSFLIKICFFILASCAAHTNLEPVGKGNFSGNVSMGGPIVKAFGAKIPVPYLTTGANYGLGNHLDLSGNFHLLSLPYKILGIEVGPTWYPVNNHGKIPTIGIQPHLLTLASFKSNVTEQVKIYPILSGSAAWDVNKGLLYLGSDLTLLFSSADYDEEAKNSILSPFIGYRWKLGQRTFLFTELKWHGANIQSNQLAVEYLPIGKNGATSLLFSLQRSF